MINWKDMGNLHVIAKMEEILGKWFGVEQFFTDTHSKIQTGHIEKDFKFRSHFMHVQMQMSHGYDFVSQDVEGVTDSFSGQPKGTKQFDSYFKHVKGVAAKVEVGGEYLGTVFAYPFISASATEEDLAELKAQMIECGAVESDATKAIESIKRMGDNDVEYLQELVDLVADEVETYHFEISKREERISELNSELGDKYRYHMMVGKSKKIQTIYRLLEKISNSESSVLIQGENGTGKELVAKAVHFYSPRKDNQFVAVNCSAFNENLLDSELFGHVKGAFTGAIKDKQGFFETANGGTLFLDEIGDTSLSMQVKLLRVLQEGTYLPVGAEGPRRCDVRILAATNKNLKEMMAKGEFREDLFYRINVINVNIPPLRDRAEDISLLMDHFLKKRCDESGITMKQLSKKCLEKMLDYPWPGNVRELENEIERLVVLSGDDKMVTPDLLSPRILDHGEKSGAAARGINTSGSLKVALEELESMMIKEGLKRCNFNKSKLSKELGVSRASLIMKVEKYGLDKRKKAAGE